MTTDPIVPERFNTTSTPTEVSLVPSEFNTTSEPDGMVSARNHLTCPYCGRLNVVAGMRPHKPDPLIPETEFNIRCWSCRKPLPEPKDGAE